MTNRRYIVTLDLEIPIESEDEWGYEDPRNWDWDYILFANCERNERVNKAIVTEIPLAGWPSFPE